MNKVLESVLSLSKTGRDMIVAMELKNILADGQKRQDLKKKIPELARQSISLSETDTQRWRQAHQAALSVDNPNRNELLAVYRDCMLDGHLKAVWFSRLEQVLKSKFAIVDDNGNEDTEKTKMLQRSWFLDYLTLAMESRLYGHSLIQFTSMLGGEFNEVELVPREHVKPEKGIFTREPNDDKGWSYLDGPLANYVVSVGKSKDLGLLLEASPNCISKKYMRQFWDEFAEVFSVPIRIGKTNTQNKEQTNKIADMLADMGRSAWGVFDQEAQIEIIQTSKNDAYQVYDKRIVRCDNEISKLIIGQTMTMDDGSSRSQAEVHQEMFEQISDADRRFLMFHINEKLVPFLIRHGYPFNNLSFKWDDTMELSFDEQLRVDQWLIDHFDIEIDYFKERYNGKIKGFKKLSTPTPSGGGEPAGK